jgi:hypothetical protein
MADTLFNPDDYSTFIPPPSSAMGQIYGNVAKKNRNSSDPIGYVFDSYDQKQQYWEITNPKLDNDTFIAENAPEVLYYGQTDPNGFENQVVQIIKAEGVTPAAINAGVQGLIDAGIYKGDPTNPLAAFNFAKNLYQEWTDAGRKWATESNKYDESPSGRLGLPDPAEDYNPLKFDNYVKWETDKIAALKKQFGNEFTPSIQKQVESIYRLRAVERNRTDGRTPYRDAILILEAKK